MAKTKRATEDKKRSRESAEDKLATDQAALEADATFGATPDASGKEGGVTCYNRACADYRTSRPIGSKCECKRQREGTRQIRR